MDGCEYSTLISMNININNNSSSSSSSASSLSKKKKRENKRRFSDDQIRSLETMFECETKLEPRKKLLLARELGLQPRQVAIWFQNKRARWKSKQLEREYSMLRANYNHLTAQFEGLKKEKQLLLQQIENLKVMMEKPQNERWQCCRQQEESTGGFSIKSPDGTEQYGFGVLSDEDSSIKASDSGYVVGFDEDVDAPDLSSMVEPEDSCLTSQENWGSLDTATDDLLDDQPPAGDDWWDFWS